MQTLVLLCGLFVVAIAVPANVPLSEEQVQKLKEHAKICIESSHTTKELIAKARNNEIVDDATLDHFMTCMFKRVGFLNDQGEFQEDVFLKKLPPGVTQEQGKQVVEACTKYSNEPVDKRATAYYRCYKNESPVKVDILSH